MRPRSFPNIDPADLRQHADEARVERVWQRVERDLAASRDGRIGHIGPRARAPFAYLAIAATFAAFGSGILLGRSTKQTRTLPSVAEAAPAPDKSLVEVLAAGTQSSSFPLEGGGRVTLQPGTTVEVERTGGAVVLSILQGEASLDSAKSSLTIAAGEARINTQAGSVLNVRRNADDIDVKVDDGKVSVSSPDGQAVIGKSEHKIVPLHAIARADAKAPPDRAVPMRRTTKPRGGVAKPSGVAEWYTHYPQDEKGALASLHALGVSQAIEGAHGAAELMAIAELMGKGGQEAGAELRALDRLVTKYPGDQRASLAADRLARIYAARGDTQKAKEYRERVQPLAEKATVGSDALICDLIRREPDKTKAALSAKEYLANYPDGECREEFERLVHGNGLAAAPSADPLAPAPPPPPPP